MAGAVNLVPVTTNNKTPQIRMPYAEFHLKKEELGHYSGQNINFQKT